MIPHLPYVIVNTTQTCLGLVVLCLLIRAKQLASYWPLIAMAIWEAPSYFVLLYVRHLGHGRISATAAYKLYFFSFWPAFAVSAICSLLFSYVLFRNAMRPLQGLQKLGNIVFTWVAVISLLTTLSVAAAPAPQGYDPLILALNQLERASALITVSLVAFVAAAIRPMGLSVHSRIFGASIGTLIVAATTAAQSSHMEQHHALYTTYAMVQLSSSCVAQLIWIYYFAKPEPERNFVLLPTTSPFHYWNDIAKRLDQEPGVVAIGGFNPNAFAGAEVEIFRRASAKMPTLDDPREQHLSEHK